MDYCLGEKKVDLATLSRFIADFFSRRHFSVYIESADGCYLIKARPKIYNKVKEIITVIIKGNSSAFSIELEFSSIFRKIRALSSLLYLFLGGYLFLRFMESEEKLEVLEKEFWVYVNNLVSTLMYN
jgi:hypothetical protein